MSKTIILSDANISKIKAAVRASFRAADGDSNDEEIEALQEARDLLMSIADISEEDTAEPDESGATRYPDIEVQLTGEDGNAFMIIGKVQQALRRAGVPEADREAFTADATSGDYNHVLATVMRWVSVS